MQMPNNKYSKEDLLRIGKNMASYFGENCFNAYYLEESNEYIFDCISHGEESCFSLEESELAQYDY